MKLSGFTMVKNATKLYYPIKESILSILPIVDEFVVALGDCDEDDFTRLEIESINSDKIRIIDTVWDLKKYKNGTENAHQTDIAKEACSGDWLFYLQADEIVHENDLQKIVEACEKHLKNDKIEGLLFNYLHFWGDYNHHQIAHGWYPKEIRIIKNNPEIHSWESAQSFRKIPNFNYVNYRQQQGTHKLNVALIDAQIYHYGWVRPPRYMQTKKKALDTIHKGNEKATEIYKNLALEFDYGPLRLAKDFTGTHPKVMEEKIKAFDWANKLRIEGPIPNNRPKFKHERLKYRVTTWLEQNIMGGRMIGGFKNYILIDE